MFRLGYITIITVSFLIATIQASERILNLEEINQIESKIIAEIKKNKIDDQKLFYHYLLAARSLKKKKNHKLAIKYYEKALALSVEQNKNRLRAYLEFGHYLLARNELSKLKTLTNKTRNFIKKQNDLVLSSLVRAHVMHTLDYFTVMVSQKLTKNAIDKDYTYFKKTHYWNAIQNYEFEKRMELGHFELALQMFNSKNTSSNLGDFYDRIVAYDLLMSIKNKKVHKELKCKKELSANPDVYHYSYDICRILITRQKTGNVDQKQILEVTNLLQTLKNRQYFIPALSKLRSL